jgi:hypothetical protein
MKEGLQTARSVFCSVPRSTLDADCFRNVHLWVQVMGISLFEISFVQRIDAAFDRLFIVPAKKARPSCV